MRFSGKVGYASTEEVAPDVYSEVYTERPLMGDVLRDARYFSNGDTVNGEVRYQTRLSVLADGFALEHFMDIRYVMWAGRPWTVETASVERPRLILVLGGVYNGKRAERNSEATDPE